MIPARSRRPALSAALAVVLALVLAPVVGPVLGFGERAQGADAERCADFALQARARERIVTGHGRDVAVLGDSYTVGLGLNDPRLAWPARLDDRVIAYGFSGSGFARTASPCPGSWFGTRAHRAAAAADTVVVEGGLNDFDRPAAEIRAGLRSVLHTLRHRRVLVVGPVSAPARAAAVPRVDRVLAQECARAGVPYLSTADLALTYQTDRLHLTPAGHRRLGDAVARRLDRLG